MYRRTVTVVSVALALGAAVVSCTSSKAECTNAEVSPICPCKASDKRSTCQACVSTRGQPGGAVTQECPCAEFLRDPMNPASEGRRLCCGSDPTVHPSCACVAGDQRPACALTDTGAPDTSVPDTGAPDTSTPPTDAGGDARPDGGDAGDAAACVPAGASPGDGGCTEVTARLCCARFCNGAVCGTPP